MWWLKLKRTLPCRTKAKQYWAIAYIINWKQELTPRITVSALKTNNGVKRKWLDGARRKPLDQQIEEVLAEWIYNRREKKLRVFRKTIIKKLFFYLQWEGKRKWLWR